MIIQGSYREKFIEHCEENADHARNFSRKARFYRDEGNSDMAIEYQYMSAYHSLMAFYFRLCIMEGSFRVGTRVQFWIEANPHKME